MSACTCPSPTIQAAGCKMQASPQAHQHQLGPACTYSSSRSLDESCRLPLLISTHGSFCLEVGVVAASAARESYWCAAGLLRDSTAHSHGAILSAALQQQYCSAGVPAETWDRAGLKAQAMTAQDGGSPDSAFVLLCPVAMNAFTATMTMLQAKSSR